MAMRVLRLLRHELDGREQPAFPSSGLKRDGALKDADRSRRIASAGQARPIGVKRVELGIESEPARSKWLTAAGQFPSRYSRTASMAWLVGSSGRSFTAD